MSTQQNQLLNKTDDTNQQIDNSVAIKMIEKITWQDTNNPQENSFYNGTEFHDKNDTESLMIPAGWTGSSTFPTSTFS
jgi:hypothetical protein